MKNLRKAIANFIYPEALAEKRSLERLAETDELTGLGNRRAYQKALGSFRGNVVLLDINNLGKLNKIHGHCKGDRMIIRAAQVMREACVLNRIPMRLFRIGGDEFAALCETRLQASTLAQASEMRFGNARFEDVSVSISASCGRTAAEADEKLQEFKAVRKALYA